jgi:peptidoglycan-N-acetylglucosamine deacetylase
MMGRPCVKHARPPLPLPEGRHRLSENAGVLGTMRLSFLWVVAAGALAGSAAFANDTQLAWFQSSSIFHSGLRDAHTIALTFDDGPNIHTDEVLDVLKQHNVKATFFVVGTMAHYHPDIIARIAAEGHLLANHSATHPELTSSYDADPEKLIDQIRIVHNEIAPFMKPGDKLFFRAPYGYWRSAHAKILNADPVLRNYIGPIYWDIGGQITMHNGYVMSSADWDCWRHKWTAQVCAKGYLREIRRSDGGVVLMHSLYAKSAELADTVIEAMQEEGYRFVRLDQVPEYRQYETPQTPPVVAANPYHHEMILVSADQVK